VPCSPGMAKCLSSCRHRAFVTEYGVARTAGVEARDSVVGTYGPGTPEYDEYRPPPVTFKMWLQQMTGWGGTGDDT
jgi:hypothetical protein